MSFRSTYILFGILILELIAFGLHQVFSPRPGEELYVLPELHRADARARGNSPDAKEGIAKDIDRVEIDHAGGEKIVFTRNKDKHWVMSEPYSTAIEDDTAVNAVIANLISARKEEKAEVRGKSLSDVGLDPPKMKVTLTKDDGKQWTLNLGNRDELRGQGLIYVTSSELPKDIMAIRTNNLESLSRSYQIKRMGTDERGKPREEMVNQSRWKTTKDFRSKELVTPSAMTLQSVDLNDGKHDLALEREGDLTRWKFTKPDYGPAEYDPADPHAPPALTGAPQVTSVRQLLNTLEGLKVAYDPDNPDKKEDDFVAENVKDLAKYGLEKGKPAYIRIGFKRGQGGSLLGPDLKQEPIKDALLIGKEVEEKSAAKPLAPDVGATVVGLGASLQGQGLLLATAALSVKPAESKATMRYARLESDNNVVKVSARGLDQLVKVVNDPSDLRNKQLVQIDEPKVDAIDIKKAGGGHLKLRRIGNEWKLWDASDKAARTDANAVNSFLKDLAPPRTPDQKPPVLSFPKDDAKDTDLGLDEKDRTGEITVWEDSVDQDAAKKDEKAEPRLKDKPGKVIKLIFGKKMEKDHTVNVLRDTGDRKTRLTLSDKMLSRLDADRLSYLDRTLPTFDEKTPLAKITIQHKGDAKKDIELVKEKKDDQSIWAIKKPDNLVGHTADPLFIRRLIEDLRNLRTDKLVAEKPADAKESEAFAKELAKYGLSPAETTVTVTHDKNDKGVSTEYIYTFGAKADKDGKLYARIEVKPADEKSPARDFVFIVQPEILKALDASVIDPTVFNFREKVADVKKLKFTWKKKGNKDQVLEVEREGTEGKWKVLNKIEGYELDSPTVSAFVHRLSTLQAAKFLDHKVTNPKPEYELDPAHRNLQIEIVLKEKVKDDKEKEKEKEKEVEKTVTLTLGKFHEGSGISPEENKENGYYDAQSSTLPGDVFTMSRLALPLTEKERQDIVEAGLKYFGRLP